MSLLGKHLLYIKYQISYYLCYLTFVSVKHKIQAKVDQKYVEDAQCLLAFGRYVWRRQRYRVFARATTRSLGEWFIRM